MLENDAEVWTNINIFFMRIPNFYYLAVQICKIVILNKKR